MSLSSKKGSKTASKNSLSLDEQLYKAVINVDKNEVTRLINEGADVNWANPKSSGNTPLFSAIEMDFPIEIVETLIAAGADPNKVNSVKERPISKAVQNGNHDIVKMLIVAGVDVKRKDKTGNSYIHYAACEEKPGVTLNYLKIINLILDNGEDVNVKNSDNFTPLHMADARGNTDVASLLIERGADITAQNNEGMTPLHMAAVSGSHKIADLLISNLRLLKNEVFRDILNKQNNEGMTPLHIAVETANIGDPKTKIRRELIARQLINYANIEITDKEKSTPLHVACMTGHIKIAELLLKKGDDIDKQKNIEPSYIRYIDRQNKNGNTPLHIATKYKQNHIVELLISRGANIDITNKLGKTASIASATGNTASVASTTGNTAASVASTTGNTAASVASTTGNTAASVASASSKTATNPAGGNRKTKGRRAGGKKTRSNRRS
jgi:ankyrin repeat protein